MKDENEAPETAGNDSTENARREALKRLGILGAYTAPAMLMLLHGKASASSSSVSSGVTN